MRDVARALRASLYWPAIAPAALLLGFGVLVLAGVGGAGAAFHVRQLTGIALGVAVAAAAAVVPYKTIVSQAYLLYAGNVVLLLLVLVAGTTRNNATRWLDVFGVAVQPSEFMKLTLVLTLARFIRFKSSYKTFRGLTTPFLLTLFPMALVLVQPDLGTALLCAPVLFAMLFVAGARMRHLATILLLGAIGIVPVYQYGLKPYQKARIESFLAQAGLVKVSEDQRRLIEEDRGYQLATARIAMGSGGFVGVGLGEGENHAARYVPERENDFVFAVIGNETGLLGTTFVLVLYGVLLLSILAVAARHRDPAGRLICVGVFAMFAIQAFVNLSMTVGMMPVTGLTLPLISAGRSSLVVSIAALALVCNVAARPSYEFGRGDFD